MKVYSVLGRHDAEIVYYTAKNRSYRVYTFNDFICIVSSPLGNMNHTYEEDAPALIQAFSSCTDTDVVAGMIYFKKSESADSIKRLWSSLMPVKQKADTSEYFTKYFYSEPAVTSNKSVDAIAAKLFNTIPTLDCVEIITKEK